MIDEYPKAVFPPDGREVIVQDAAEEAEVMGSVPDDAASGDPAPRRRGRPPKKPME